MIESQTEVAAPRVSQTTAVKEVAVPRVSQTTAREKSVVPRVQSTKTKQIAAAPSGPTPRYITQDKDMEDNNLQPRYNMRANASANTAFEINNWSVKVAMMASENVGRVGMYGMWYAYNNWRETGSGFPKKYSNVLQPN